MTRVEKSPEQLDAEAAGHGFDNPDAYDPPSFRPSPPPLPAGAPTMLRWLIVDLRRALWMETPEKLHQRQSSGLRGELDAKGWPIDTDEGGIGVPFSNGFHRWLGSTQRLARSKTQPWGDRGADPHVRPAMASIIEISEWCHPRHTSHAMPGSSRSLCGQLAFEVGYLGQELEDIAWLHDLDAEQIERMLTDALRHARLWRIDIEWRLSRSPEPEPLPERRPFRPAASA